MNSILFTPGKIGPLTIRNRTIRSAAFESMCPGNAPSQELLDYHKSVAAGGVGMTTVAYAAVTQSGLSFDRQLWMRPEIVAGMQLITDGSRRKHPVRALRKHVPPEHLRADTRRRLYRIQPVLADLRPRITERGIARNGKRVWKSGKSGTRMRI